MNVRRSAAQVRPRRHGRAVAGLVELTSDTVRLALLIRWPIRRLGHEVACAM